MYRAYILDVLLFRDLNVLLDTQVKSVGVWYDMGRLVGLITRITPQTRRIQHDRLDGIRTNRSP